MILRRSITTGIGRHQYLRTNYMQGNVLDIGNLGGERTMGGNFFSGHRDFVAHAQKSIVYGFDVYEPSDPSKYPNQKTGDLNDGLPYESGFFNTVYMGELLEHLGNPLKALTEINRVLVMGGVLILDTPNAFSIRRILRFLIKGSDELGGDPTHLIFYTPASLKRIVEEAGFTVKNMSEKGSFLKGFNSTLLLTAEK